MYGQNEMGAAKVRFGSLADICAYLGDVRFTPKSGHYAVSFD
jgi:hypothetical protein